MQEAKSHKFMGLEMEVWWMLFKQNFQKPLGEIKTTRSKSGMTLLKLLQESLPNTTHSITLFEKEWLKADKR